MAKRLDQVLLNHDARLDWLGASVCHIPVFGSDYSPLLLSFEPVRVCNKHWWLFRFEAILMTHASFHDLIDNKWDQSIAASVALCSLKDSLL